MRFAGIVKGIRHRTIVTKLSDPNLKSPEEYVKTNVNLERVYESGKYTLHFHGDVPNEAVGKMAWVTETLEVQEDGSRTYTQSLEVDGVVSLEARAEYWAEHPI